MKKNLRLVPQRITSKIQNSQERFFKVSTLVSFTSEKIREGYLSHLNISLDDSGLHFQQHVVPNEDQGKHSNKNVNGEIIVRDDLPKITKIYTWEVPNWGDYSNGTHDIDVPREVYRRDFIPPHYVGINIECPNALPGQQKYSILFSLDEVLDKNANDFETRLLDLVNIIQENIYTCDVYPSNSSYQDYLSTIQLAWEIFPPGQREIVLQRIVGTSTNHQQNTDVENRLNFIMSLNPVNIILGSSGLQRYLGAQIMDNLVVFENIKYGNAIYIMYDNWDVLSQRSRTELLSGVFGNNFDRILHLSGWENKVRAIIDSRLNSNLALTA